MLCGLALSLQQIVIYRLLQGVFGAALVTLSQAVMMDIYPREKQGQAMAIWGMGVMLGPILGPTLGGWLTETYDWRWVFFVNLPFGILTVLGLVFIMPDTAKDPAKRFDWFGFATLSVAIGAFQMMLDRGEQLNWFQSTEILIEAVTAALSLYLFVVHTLTAEKPFIEPALFRDRNLVTGLIFMFAVGVILLATIALLTPYLQTMMGYPVLTAGIVLGPRGIGTLIAMMLVGRMVGKYDARLLIFIGMALTAYSLWDMAGFTPDVSATRIMVTGFIQGMGLGFVFVPLSTISFATLLPRQRTDGASLLSLVRNIGSAIGVSIVIFMLTQNTARMHADLAVHVTPFRDAIAMLRGGLLDPATDMGRAIIDQLVTREAAIIAYADDYRLMLWITLASIPLLLLMKKPDSAQPAAHAAMD
jgi:DHA2 family multidrug resistance protein